MTNNRDKTNKGKVIENTPQGSFTTTGILEPGSDIRHTGSFGPNNVLSDRGDIIVDLILRDPHTGRTVRMEDIRVESSLGTLVTGIPEEGIFDVFIPSYSDFQKRNTSGMVATPKDTSVTAQNLSLPQRVKVKDAVDSFSQSQSPVCKQYNEEKAAAQRHLGLVHERDDITIVQGRRNGRSPGMVVDQGGGYVSLFGVDGKQNVNIAPGAGITLQGASYNTGGALHQRTSMQYGGLPQIENPVNDTVPQGTILMPQPKTLPDIIFIMHMVYTVTDMIELVNACADAVSEIYG